MEHYRRTLSPAHDELIDRRYLKQVTYEGEGRNQVVVYERMAQSPALPLTERQMVLIGRVKALGVTPGQASRFVLSVSGVEARVALAEAVVNSTRTFRMSRGALAWDILNDMKDRYAFPKAQEGSSETKALLASRTSAQPALLDLPEPEASIATVSILARSYLDKKDLARLTGLISEGKRDLSAVQKGLVKAKAEQRADAFLQEVLQEE